MGITRYLQEHLAEDISLSILAEEFHLSGQYISQLFKSEIGVNFLSYLTGIRMEKAKQLLATALPIAEISVQSGYGDYRVFTKVFKKSEGVTPLNCTPFVRRYDILSNKWGVLLCQKEYQTNDIRRNLREWL